MQDWQLACNALQVICETLSACCAIKLPATDAATDFLESSYNALLNETRLHLSGIHMSTC